MDAGGLLMGQGDVGIENVFYQLVDVLAGIRALVQLLLHLQCLVLMGIVESLLFFFQSLRGNGPALRIDFPALQQGLGSTHPALGHEFSKYKVHN